MRKPVFNLRAFTVYFINEDGTRTEPESLVDYVVKVEKALEASKT
jgi:hypothetical protein